MHYSDLNTEYLHSSKKKAEYHYIKLSKCIIQKQRFKIETKVKIRNWNKVKNILLN